MKNKISYILHFLTYDIWRITENEVTRRKLSLYNVIKTIYICIDRFTTDRLTNKASALTYSTLLAIVPILAILFAIARGFGFANLMEAQLRMGFAGNQATMEAIFSFVDSYLAHAKSGIFIGVGLVMLLWTVLNLISNIEITFNRIWQVKKERSMYRKMTDYFSMLLLMPIFIVVSGGLSIFMSTVLNQMDDYILLAPIIQFLLQLIPFLLTWLMFTGLYIFMPNTKVKFKYAAISGLLAGSAYQGFQFLYISGQVWVSNYNAIYGSFAALPLFLLWLQISWTICLFGAELTYAGQNIEDFNFDKDTRNISRRYNDFLTIFIMSLIAKRFEKGDSPYTAKQISINNQIPIRLVQHILYHLQEMKIIHEVTIDEKSEEIAYQPSIDIHKLTVSVLIQKIDAYGSENFKMGKNVEFSQKWEVLMELRKKYYNQANNILIKDL